VYLRCRHGECSLQTCLGLGRMGSAGTCLGLGFLGATSGKTWTRTEVWCVLCGVCVVCGVWFVVCGVWFVVCGVWCVVCCVCVLCVLCFVCVVCVWCVVDSLKALWCWDAVTRECCGNPECCVPEGWAIRAGSCLTASLPQLLCGGRSLPSRSDVTQYFNCSISPLLSQMRGGLGK
jgi:hypothetical protein